MKAFTQFFIFICMVALVCCNNRPVATWKLVWEDNFDQADSFDETFWSKIPRGSSDWNNYMSDFDSCYDVRDGNLVLRGIVNHSFPEDTVPYLTGGIYTKDKYNFGLGRIEIKAKLQGATGAWPAIWMLAQDRQWPDGGEIDIMERLNFEAQAYQTVHTHYTYTLGIKEPKQGATGPINPDDYNVYGLEIYQDSLCFFINNQHTFTYPRVETDKKGQFPFNEYPFYLLIDMQLGGSWVGKVNPDDLPVEMMIDWVRYYQK